MVDRSSTQDEVWEFFAYAHVGEEGVNRDFSYYVDAKIDKKVAAVFARVSSDEANHIVGTEDVLREMTRSKWLRFEYLVLKSRIKRNFKQIEAVTRVVGDAALSLVLALVYFSFGVFLARRLRERFLRIDHAEVLSLLRQQQDDLPAA